MIKMTPKAWRRAKGLSQSDVAKQMGLPLRTYIYKENKPERFYFNQAVKLSEVLEVDVNLIIFG